MPNSFLTASPAAISTLLPLYRRFIEPSPLRSSILCTGQYSVQHQKRNGNTNTPTNSLIHNAVIPTRDASLIYKLV